MGRLRRTVAVAVLLAVQLVAALPGSALGFSGFGTMTADATYGDSMTFDVALIGGAPDRLEILLRFAGDEGTFVAPVQPEGSGAEYVWDAADSYVTPNTSITYSWRATHGDTVTVSPERTLLYDDDRPGLDWRSARLGEATVHWYGSAEGQARRFGELSADGAARAEELLGHEMNAPVDIFVYDTQDDFFGALGPGAREWTGAATYPQIRTIFMWLGAGGASYLDPTLIHEVTHVVFDDATTNPFHEPAKWLNEGLATWAERQSADDQEATVEFEADSGLFAFEAISEQFPIGDRGAGLSYAQGATMVDLIIEEYGREAMARIAAAYRDGASDSEALEAGTGVPIDELYDQYYTRYGVEAPQPIEPEPLLPSNVRKPGGAAPGESPGNESPGGEPGNGDGDQAPADDGAGLAWLAIAGAVVVVAGLGGATWLAQRRVRRREEGGP